MSKKDSVNNPNHYSFSDIETIDVIECWDLCFHLGNVIKYISRNGHKGNSLEDLKKARWYLDRKIKNIELNNTDSNLYGGLYERVEALSHDEFGKVH